MARDRTFYGLVSLFVLAIPSGAKAQRFDVPAQSLGRAVGVIGQQARVTITVTDADLAASRTSGVRGRMTLREALERVLRNTGAEAIFYDPTTIRIVRRRKSAPPGGLLRPAQEAPSEQPPEDIIVVASKQSQRLHDYPGSVKIIDARGDWAARNGADGMSAVTRSEPTVQSTDLGQGRDKLFVRGIADSSFRGQTQAITGQYLGDVRLTYNAPDPSLNLYDVERVEVLIGPQAPLYGAGSLGGVVRIVPNGPDVRRPQGSFSSNVGTTRYGGISHDVALMMNIPLATDHLAIRVVGFAGTKGGYIDAPRQGRRNINSARSSGYRATGRLEDIGGWSVDFGSVEEDLHSRDGQYTLRDTPPLTRETAIAQPFASDYNLRYVTARREAGTTRIVSTTANVHHRLTTVFDASALFGPSARYDERNTIEIWSHETRWSGGDRRAPWVFGVSGIHNSSRSDDAIRSADAAAEVGFLNRNFETALFGQLSKPVVMDLTVFAGGRLGYTRSDGAVTTLQGPSPRFHREVVRFSRTIGLNWTPPGRLSAFLRHDQGYRAGGLAVFPTGEGTISQSYRPDTLDMYELGLRHGVEGRDPLILRTSLFLTNWANVQADLATVFGFTFTANVGRGQIKGIDGEIIWRAAPGLTVRTDVFLNDGRLSTAGDDIALTGRRRLPNVAGAGGRLGLNLEEELDVSMKLRADASLRYVGRSWLGTGLGLDIAQGGYVTAEIGASLDLGPITLALRANNLTDTRGNTFAFGNPFTVLKQDQMTPLRPRTIKIGLDARF